ncbi:MAG: N-acetylmuramoyl-L-alanine amidase [Rhodocyclales bacterium]|nr:N-acetylmuramoyl-L-alanine amidase [Rhodocyclales bacterium]
MSAPRWIAALGEDGRIASAQRIDSPNHDERPDGCGVDLVVIHAISLPPEQFGGPGVEQLFTNQLDPAAHPYYASVAQLRVSAHFFIRRDGSLLQFVPTTARAWHAGVSSWRGRERCNDFSIGIELEGSDSVPFRAEQYDCLSGVLRRIRERHPHSDICGHSDIAPGRKTDPGPYFEWARLYALLASA